jgi:hypothetical protein
MATFAKRELDADACATRIEHQQETRLAIALVAAKTGAADRYLGLIRRRLMIGYSPEGESRGWAAMVGRI